MSTLRRGHRMDPPEMPGGTLQLQAPPELQPHEGASQALMTAIPMLGSVGSIVLVASMSAGADSSMRTRSMIAAGMFLFATLGFVFVQIDRTRKQRNQQVTGSRTEYLRYLAGVRATARDAARRQRDALTWRHPDPAVLPSLAEDRSRLWERTSRDPFHLQIRYGVAPQPLSLELVPPDSTQIDQVDPASASALHRLLVVHRVQPDLPAALDLRAFDRIELTGDNDRARALARSLVCSAAAFHNPDDLVIAVLASDQTLARWDWIKWLPHTWSTRESDAVGPRRMVTTDLDDLAAMLPGDLSERPRFSADDPAVTPHLVVVLDGVQLPPGNHVLPPDGIQGVTMIDLPPRWGELDDASRLRFHLEPLPLQDGRAPISALRLRADAVRALGDQCDLATAEAFARRLAPLHTGSASDTGEVTGPTDYLEMLGLGDVHTLATETAWRPRPARDRLRVPIGVSDNGQLVHLDIKESALQGMGPHGICIGATGSGKSEFLRTLVLGLTLTHSPEQLNLVLVDFKGGATFAGMSEMPHVSAVITNLADELTLVDRMQDAMSGEMVRRQELLRTAGNYQNISDYEKARAAGEPLDPLPSLFIVVDEFSELLTAKPEFIDLFLAIGRIGRSLGIHLLLASQRLEEGRLRGLDTYLSYRIGLRTFSAAESRSILGVPDAYELPAVPGLGYLKTDQSTLMRFKAGYVSGPPSGRARVQRDAGGQIAGILPFTVAAVRALAPAVADEPAPVAAAPTGEQPSVLDIAVERMVEQRTGGAEAHQVWLPPLDVPDTLDRLLGDLIEDPELGLVSPRWRGLGALTVPIGVVDRPREQRRDTLTVQLTGAGGHAAIVGGPQSGKSTLLRTLVCSLALTTTPLESQFYVLDFGGGTFAPLARLPHVAGVGTRAEPDVVRRIVAEVKGIVDRREAYFRQHGIDSVETYRSRRQQGRADDGYGDVFLVVDGWATLRQDFDDLEMELQALAQRGLTFGLHLVVGAARWADFRAAARDVFGTRLELRLGDAMDSEFDRKVAQLVPAGRPGRGLTGTKHHFLAALPRLDSQCEVASLGDGVDALIARVAAAWKGKQPPKLRLLPARIDLDDVRLAAGEAASAGRLLLGINERDLAPVGIDIETSPHLVAYGDAGSGKSALLRSVIHEIVRTRTPKQAQIIAVDYRRSLLGEIPADYQLDYLTSQTQAGPALKDLADYLTNRLPGPDVTPDQLRNRSWWSGSEAWLLVDDYDLVASSAGSPVAPLVPLLAQARDVGLHVVLVRRSGGAGRASYEPVLQGMRDLSAPTLLLSGSPEEGAITNNVKMVPAPPGRARMVSRDGLEVVQLAWTDPTH